MNIIETNLDFNGLTKRSATNRIILHNSGVTVEQSVETIHNYHKNSLKWAGFGYHFYVRKNGEIFRGRPEDTIGAHAYGSNNDSIGICAEGNFDVETMSNEQKTAIAELLRYLTNKYNIDKIQGHRDVCNTSCPGANYPMQEIIDMVNNVETLEQEETEGYLVRITTDALNIRQGTGTDTAAVGCIRDRGIYTIVETADNWGRLKSGAGWICLDYTQKLDGEVQPIYKTVTAKSGLNIRENATTNSRRLGGVAYNQKVEVLEENVAQNNGHAWDKVKFGNVVGYVANTYLR